MGPLAPRTRVISPVAGVEVLGLDLSSPSSAEEASWLAELLAEHLLLLFRNQSLSDADHVRVMGYLGPVLDETFDGTRVSFVSNVDQGAFVPEGRLLFHADLAFCPEPLPVNSLYALEVPPDGAPTRFANAERAVGRLAPELRRRLEGRSALHLQDLRSQRSDRRFRRDWVPDDQPRARHPVLRPNPRTGRLALFVNELQTDAILGLEPEESEELLRALFEVLYAPENVLEHRWRPGDLVIWDNGALQHGRPEMPTDAVRRHRRVVLGERGTVEQVAGFRPTFLTT